MKKLIYSILICFLFVNLACTMLSAKEVSYYIVGSFNDYKIEEKYKLEKNDANFSYKEYLINLDLKKGSTFYITDGENKYTSPKGTDILINLDGNYDIYFSLDHDYGNGYNLYYQIKKTIVDDVTFKVKTKDDLKEAIKSINLGILGSNITIELLNDIDMENELLESIDSFNGTINGNHFKIYNFRLDPGKAGNAISFIRTLEEGSIIKDLTLDYNCTNEVEDRVTGGIVGINYGEIYNSLILGNLTGTNILGGIAGVNEDTGIITSCTNNASLIGYSFVGGIAGINKGKISLSNNYNNLNQTRFTSSNENSIINLGGIAGFNQGIIDSSFNNGTISYKETGNMVGGIAGSNIGSITSCYNKGKITGNKFIGGITGYYAEVNNKINDSLGFINKILEEYLGKKPILKPLGTTSTIKYCYNLGLIYGETIVGGIVGFQSSESKLGKDTDFDIMLCFNRQDITANNTYCGGIVGKQALGVISDTFNTGIIETIKGDYCGGIVGSNNGTVTNSFVISNVKGHSYIGGISGYANNINNCYTIVNIYSDGYFAGAISGDGINNSENISNNYYVYSGINGIDDSNIMNKAELVDRNLLASKDILNLPLDFNHFIASTEGLSFPVLRKMLEMNEDIYLANEFKANIKEVTKFSCNILFCTETGEIISMQRITYGDTFSLSLLPPVIEKEGYFVKWEDFDNSSITKDLVVKLVYTKKYSSIANEEGTKPLLIIEGSFYPTTKVSIEEFNPLISISDIYKMHKGYKFTVTDSSNPLVDDSYKVRIRIDEKIKKPIIGVIKDGNLEIVDYEVSNSYLVFTTDASEFVILSPVFFTFGNQSFVVLFSITITSIVLLGTVIPLTIYFVKKHKKNKK